MTEQEIKDGNILLEGFVSGRRLLTNGVQLGRKRGSPQKYENWYDLVHVDDLKYHSSYDALMSAWLKFRELKVDAKGKLVSHDDMKFIIHCHLGYSAIEVVFEKLVAAVKYINQLNRKS